MKSILQTKLVVAVIGCMSLAVFAIVVSNRTAQLQKSALQKSRAAARRISSNRRERGQSPPGLEQAFGLTKNTPVNFSITPQDQSTRSQQSKFSPDVVAMV